MSYVLIILVGGFFHSSPVSIAAIEFHDLAACEAAGAAAAVKFAPFSAGKNAFVCVEKGRPHDH